MLARSIGSLDGATSVDKALAAGFRGRIGRCDALLKRMGFHVET